MTFSFFNKRKYFLSKGDKRNCNFLENKPATTFEQKDILLSAVIGSFNRKKLLQRAIESVRENQIDVPYEIIVVDGGSTDGTIKWLVSQKDIITIIQHNRREFKGKRIQRRSWGYFMNLGFKAAQGKYILMISDDCLLLKGAVNYGLDLYSQNEEKHEKIGGVAFYFRNWPNEEEYHIQLTLGGNLMVNHGIFLKQALEEVGFADEKRYFFYKADGDLCLKLWEKGYEIIECENAFVEHYLNEKEMVRQSNNEVLEKDRKAYYERWNGIFYNPIQKDLRRKMTKIFQDPDRTAERKWSFLSRSK